MFNEMNVFRIGWVVMCLCVISLVVYSLAYFLPDMPYGFRPETYRNTVNTLPLLLHIGGGIIAVLAGLFQFSGHFRNTYRAWHKRLGYLYLMSVTVSSLAVFTIIPVVQGGFSSQIAFSLLAILWLFTTGMGYAKILMKDWASHRQWMIRSYALSLAFVSLRIWLGGLAATGAPFDEVYQAVAWLCWVPNILIAQYYLDSKTYKERQSRIGLSVIEKRNA